MVKERILLRMSLREIKTNLKQYLALILISLLAVTLFIGLTSNAKSLQSRVDDLYAKSNIADIFVYVDRTSDEEKYKLKDIEGVKEVEKRLSCSGYFDSHTSSFFIASEMNKLNQYYEIEEGGERGLLVDKHFKILSDKKVGDTISFTLPISLRNLKDEMVNKFASAFNFDSNSFLEKIDSALKEGANDPFQTDELVLSSTLTGFMEHPEAAEVSTSTSVRVMLDSEFLEDEITLELGKKINESYEDGEKDIDFFNTKYSVKQLLLMAINSLSINDFCNQYLIKAKNNVNLQELNSRINNYFTNNEDSSTLITSLTKENLPTTITLETDVSQAEKLSLVFPLIFFIVAILVVLTSLSQLIYKSRSDIGTMKAIGISKGKILFHYIWFGIILSFIGCFLGSIIGPLLIPKIMNNKYDILYNLPRGHIVFPMLHIVLCTLIFCLLSGFVSFLVSRGEVNLSPVESMRPKVLKELKGKKKKSDKQVKPFLLSMRMAIRNIKTKLSRTFMVIFGVMGCTALLVSGYGIMDTINYGVDLDFNKHMLSQISLSYGTSGSEKEKINSLEGIKTYEPYMSIPIQSFYGEHAFDTTITLYESDSPTCYDFASFIDKGVVLSYETASKLNINVGDMMRIIYMGNSYELRVDYLFESSYLLQMYTKKDNLKDIEFKATGAEITLKDNYKEEDVKKEIEDLNLGLGSLSTSYDLQKRIKDILGSVEIMCNTVKIFAILLAIVVTYNLALLNFNERKRDIATLKVIGCKKSEIMFSFIGEIFFLTLIGVICGLFLGYPLLVIILKVNQTSLFHFLYHIFFKTYLLSVLISLGSSAIVNMLLGRLSSKVDAVSALKSVE